jgi:hypothetical protein
MGKPKTAASLLYPIDMYVNWDETSKRWNMDLEQASVPACSVSVSLATTINKIASQNSEGRLEENTRAGL